MVSEILMCKQTDIYPTFYILLFISTQKLTVLSFQNTYRLFSSLGKLSLLQKFAKYDIYLLYFKMQKEMKIRCTTETHTHPLPYHY